MVENIKVEGETLIRILVIIPAKDFDLSRGFLSSAMQLIVSMCMNKGSYMSESSKKLGKNTVQRTG